MRIVADRINANYFKNILNSLAMRDMAAIKCFTSRHYTNRIIFLDLLYADLVYQDS